jgi:hypothetical protein
VTQPTAVLAPSAAPLHAKCSFQKSKRGWKSRMSSPVVGSVPAMFGPLWRLQYWAIGNEILARQPSEGWGTKVIDSLSRDQPGVLRHAGVVPSESQVHAGFCGGLAGRANCATACCTNSLGDNVRLLDQVKSPEERTWYVQQTIANGWSRNILEMQIEGELYRRQGKAQRGYS